MFTYLTELCFLAKIIDQTGRVSREYSAFALVPQNNLQKDIDIENSRIIDMNGRFVPRESITSIMDIPYSAHDYVGVYGEQLSTYALQKIAGFMSNGNIQERIRDEEHHEVEMQKRLMPVVHYDSPIAKR